MHGSHGGAELSLFRKKYFGPFALFFGDPKDPAPPWEALDVTQGRHHAKRSPKAHFTFGITTYHTFCQLRERYRKVGTVLECDKLHITHSQFVFYFEKCSKVRKIH